MTARINQSSDRYEPSAEMQTPFCIVPRLKQPSVQSISSQPTALIPVESLDIADDLADHEEVSFHIPAQRFRHIVSSTTPKSIGNQLARECSVCFLFKPESEYRASLSKDCQHSSRTVCYDCVYHNIVMLLGSSINDQIRCPELICSARLDTEEVRHILTYYDNMPLLNKYDTYLMSALLEKMPEFIWCAHGCGSGQLHPSFTQKEGCANTNTFCTQERI